MEVYESPLHFLMTGSRFKPGHRFDGYELRVNSGVRALYFAYHGVDAADFIAFTIE